MNPASLLMTVSFSIGSDDLIPEEVTRELNLIPSHAAVKGTPRPTKRVPLGKYPTGVWLLRSALPATADLSRHLASLLDVLEPRREVVMKLASRFHVHFRAGMSLDENDRAVILLDAEILERLGRFGVSLDIEVE